MGHRRVKEGGGGAHTSAGNKPVSRRGSGRMCPKDVVFYVHKNISEKNMSKGGAGKWRKN